MAKEKQTIQWTTAQGRAIETVGRDVLVTASAGTGKTAVLSHRAVERICDPADAAQADNLLVMTFTETAAEEMRGRIAETLRQRFASERDGRLRAQLLLLDRAYISTIHAFCKRILTEFFYLIDLDPTFGILDADEQRLLKSELLEKMLQSAWEDESLAAGLEILFAGRRIQPGTGSFVDKIIPLSEFLDSVVERGVFYDRAAAVNDIHNTAFADVQATQKAFLLQKLARCRAKLEHALKLDAEYTGSGYATDYIHRHLTEAVETAETLLKKDRFDLCAAHVAQLDFGRMPAFKKKQWDESFKDAIKAPIDAVKADLKSLADVALLCSDYAALIGPQASLQTKVLMELLRRFDESYASAKRSRNVLDFADLEHTLLALLEKSPATAETLRQRFAHIFVDEYQDVNAVQQQILEKLSRDDNVFVVGDVKQSIYGFRQSKPEIFLARLKDAVDISTASTRGGRVDLQDNFRCRAEIIDFVNTVFAPVMCEAVADMDYDDKAALVSGFDYPPFEAKSGPNRPVELHLLDEESGEDNSDTESTGPTETVSASQRQATFIARRIRQIVGADTGAAEFQIFDKKESGFRDVQYRDCVILMRSLSHKAQEYVEILRLAGVPVSSQSACGYFEATEISDCVCLLKVLDNADRDIELAALLRSPIFRLTDSQLAAIRLTAGKRSGFYQAVLNYAESGPDVTLKETLNAVLTQLADWRTRLRHGSLANLLDAVFREKDLLAFYAALPNGAQRRANLLKLHDHAIQFEHFRTTEPGAALGRFVEFLEKLADAEQDWAPAEPDSAGENAVRIMSVHKSKGLEFPVVFAAELNTAFNMRDAAGDCLIDEQTVGLQVIDANAAGKFPTMAHQVIAERHRKANIAEEMRILYVALTRAREKLILTASKKASACEKLLAECAAFEQIIPNWRVAEGRCHLDWILMGLVGHRGLCNLFEVTGGSAALPESLLHASRINRDELEAETTRILDAKRSLTCWSELPKPGSEQDKQSQTAFETIRNNLLWHYPHQDVTEISAKLSVSELTHGSDEFAAVNVAAAFLKKPAATATSGKIPDTANALSVGTAVHAVLERVDLAKPVNDTALSQTVKMLTEKGLLDATTAKQIDLNAIAAFFNSDLGQLTQQAGDGVLREWPFTYGLNANAAMKEGQEPLTTENNEIVVVQGIVDMIIPTDGGLVIVDFKTDRVTGDAIQERADRYSRQLQTYAKAAGDILQKPITAAWLYFLTPQQAVEVELKN